MTKHFTLLVTGIISLVLLVPVALADDYAGKRILHIDSYHRGNIWNDRIADAVQAYLKDTGVTLKIIHMDTKRNASEAFKKAAALKAKGVIDTFQPHVVTTSDDNAAKYLIMAHYKNADLPFVFSGLNWDASSYDLPYKNVTGMVEVSPVPQIIELLKQYAGGERIGYLTEDTKTKRKELDYHKKLFNIEYDQVYLVKSFAEWKESYLRAQDEVDMLIILGVAALTDWDDKEAQILAENHTKIPTGTDFSWLMHISMLGVGKSPEEQGRWSAQAALKILDGVEPSRIPLTHNTEGKLYFNRKIAASMGIDNVPPLATVVP